VKNAPAMFVNSSQPTVPSETRRLIGLTRGCWEEGSQKGRYETCWEGGDYDAPYALIQAPESEFRAVEGGRGLEAGFESVEGVN